MLTKVIELEVMAPYALRVRFNNAQAGTRDCSKLVLEAGPMIEPLRDPAFFARAFLEFGAPTWPSGFECRLNGCVARCKTRASFQPAPHEALWPRNISRLERGYPFANSSWRAAQGSCKVFDELALIAWRLERAGPGRSGGRKRKPDAIFQFATC